MKNNKFLELSSSPLMNLDHTKRYSGTKLVEDESLSQHIVDTIMMGLKIIDTINSLAGCEVLEPERYVMKAVYHDLEEVITGDIPRPVKYYSEATRESLKDVADSVAKKFFNEQFSDGNPHYDIWERAKDGIEGYILRIVDNLVVSNKVIREVVLLNNFYMLRVAHEVVQYTHTLYNQATTTPIFEGPIQDYILSLLKDSIDVMEEILAGHRKTMDSLDIYGQSMI